MARYFFHIKDDGKFIEDEEGTELATAQDARARALLSAREMLASAIRFGRPLEADAVVVADENGYELTSVLIAEALPDRLKVTWVQ